MSAMLFDMPMDSSQDIDMHAGLDMHSTWLDAEIHMDEDQQERYSDTQSVEIDMDNQYDYEMEEEQYQFEEMSADVDDAPESVEDATLLPADPEPVSDEGNLLVVDAEEAVQTELTVSPFLVPDAELPDVAVVPLAPDVEAEVSETVDEEAVEVTAAAEEMPEEPFETAAEEREGEGAGLKLVGAHADADPQIESLNVEALAGGPEEPPDVPEELHVPVDAPQDLSVPDDETGTDPHEISDGVYIDPPPAIVVAFDSPNCPDICLFNQPIPSRSPSPGHVVDNPPVFELLLQHSPILYYEPLSAVFDALRREEYVARFPNLADSELTLDASDLQLTISEDNVHAREVSLHDLNVLHDASNISGPLRLRLKTSEPRFIVRYRALQSHLARLNTADAGDDDAQHHDLEEPTEENQTATEEQYYEAPEVPESDYVPDVAPAQNEQGDATSDAAAVTAQAPQEDGSQEANEQPGAAAEEFHGENVEHDVVPPLADGAAEEQGEEETFVVVDPSDVPSEPAVTLDQGNELKHTPNPSSTSVHQAQAEAGPSKLAAATAGAEDEQEPVANDSVDAEHEESFVHEEQVTGEEGEEWDDAEEGLGDADLTWEAEADHDTLSTKSSVTLSSRASKRSIDEIEAEEDELGVSPPSSPGPKRTRVD